MKELSQSIMPRSEPIEDFRKDNHVANMNQVDALAALLPTAVTVWYYNTEHRKNHSHTGRLSS